jgi:broad specificity phosphatase PhoE
MRNILVRTIVADWILKPLAISICVLVLGGTVVAIFSEHYSFEWREAINRRLYPDYERKLSAALLAELRAGGYTLFVRHGSRDRGSAPSNPAFDRAYLIDPSLMPPDFRSGICLNEVGRAESRLLGQFFRRAKIPVGEVLASPLCRARETAELSVERVDRIDPDLVIDNVFAGAAERAPRAARLRKLLDQTPRGGTNRLLFSHSGVLETQGYERLRLEEAGVVILQHTKEGTSVRAIVSLREMINALPLPTGG